jgi:hypothetical protein
MKNYKPLNGKCYYHIPHLSGSKRGSGDHTCNIGDEIRATVKVKDRHDRIIVQEKLDGSSVGVVKLDDGYCMPLIKSGYMACHSKYVFHRRHFVTWVWENYHRFNSMLDVGERVCAEWMILAHGTRYILPHEPFVVFDIMRENKRICYDVLKERTSKYGFITPHVIHVGGSLSINDAMNKLGTYGYHGAIDPAEGCVWRIERNELVDRWNNSGPREWTVESLVKYVRSDKQNGIYLKEKFEDSIWNLYKRGDTIIDLNNV